MKKILTVAWCSAAIALALAENFKLAIIALAIRMAVNLFYED